MLVCTWLQWAYSVHGSDLQIRATDIIAVECVRRRELAQNNSLAILSLLILLMTVSFIRPRFISASCSIANTCSCCSGFSASICCTIFCGLTALNTAHRSVTSYTHELSTATTGQRSVRVLAQFRSGYCARLGSYGHMCTVTLCWWRSIVVKTSVLAGELSLSCARLIDGCFTTVWVKRPLSVNQQGQFSLPSLRDRLNV